jgi:hypothetical protein
MLALAACLLTVGCFWRSYGPRMHVHADVLRSMARKGADLVRAGRFEPGSLPELLYPLDRARAFAARARARSAADPPPSLGAFDALLDAYAALCTVLDEQRRFGTAGDEVRVATALARVEGAAAAVERALATEGR